MSITERAKDMGVEKLVKENRKLKEKVEELEWERSRDGLLWQATMEEAYNRITDLEKENKKLNEFKEKRKESRFYFKAQMERAEPKTAREAEDLQRAKEIFEKLYREELSWLKEENEKLKSDLANIQCEFWFACEEIDYRKREDKELRKWIKEHVDYQTQADFRKRFEHK